ARPAHMQSRFACGTFRRIRRAPTTPGSFTISTVAHWIRRSSDALEPPPAQDFENDGLRLRWVGRNSGHQKQRSEKNAARTRKALFGQIGATEDQARGGSR